MVICESPLNVQAFTEAHPQRKVVKRWVHNKVKDIAEHTGGVWVIKQSAPKDLPADVAASEQHLASQNPPAATPEQQRPPSAGTCQSPNSSIHSDSIKCTGRDFLAAI